MRRRRIALAAELPGAAARAAALAPLEELPPFAIVGGYVPRGSEFDPGPLLARLEGAGAQLVFPVDEDRGPPLVFRRAGRREGPLAAPDLIIAPLLAFDAAGGRLGQGAGCYDRTLKALRAAGPLFVIGLAYSGQEVDGVPGEAHDQRIDAILTESGYRVVLKDF